MSHTFLIIPLDQVPDWTKENVPSFWLGRFSNDNRYMVIDNAHPDVVYEKWLGPNKDILPALKASCTVLTKEEFLQVTLDPESEWYAGHEEDSYANTVEV
jgi:hypothetical protein